MMVIMNSHGLYETNSKWPQEIGKPIASTKGPEGLVLIWPILQ